MNVIFKLNVKDYIDFNYWYARRSIAFVNAFYAVLIIGILFLLLGLPNKKFETVMDMVLLLVLVLFLVYFNTGIYFRSKKIFGSDAFLQQEQTYNITSESISVTTQRSSAIIKWDEVYSFTESKDSFYIFLARNKAYLLPKRFLGDAAAQELIQLAIANMPPKKVKLRK